MRRIPKADRQNTAHGAAEKAEEHEMTDKEGTLRPDYHGTSATTLADMDRIIKGVRVQCEEAFGLLNDEQVRTPMAIKLADDAIREAELLIAEVPKKWAELR
jgi:hypothetical protein